MTMLIIGLVAVVVVALLIALAMLLKGDVTAGFKTPLVVFSLDAKDKKKKRTNRPARRSTVPGDDHRSP